MPITENKKQNWEAQSNLQNTHSHTLVGVFKNMNSKVARLLRAHLKNNDFDIEWQSIKSTEMYPLSLGNSKHTHAQNQINDI